MITSPEDFFVAEKRSFQRCATQEALLALAIQDLQRIDSLAKLPEAVAMIACLPAEGAEYLRVVWQEARRRIHSVSELAQNAVSHGAGEATPCGAGWLCSRTDAVR